MPFSWLTPGQLEDLALEYQHLGARSPWQHLFPLALSLPRGLLPGQTEGLAEGLDGVMLPSARPGLRTE